VFILSAFIWAAKFIVGPGLILGCGRGLFSGEGKWDAESARIMQWSNVVGILIGAALLCSGLGLYDIPFVPFI
jgi:hypothetical protein